MQNDRRSFIKNFTALTTGALSGAGFFILQGCTSFRSLVFQNRLNTITVTRAQFNEIKDGLVNYHRLPAPIYLKEHDNGDYTALLLECTHKQCEVSPAGKILICPCHGSEFTDRGKVLNGPAEYDLHRFNISVEANNILINLES